MNMGPIGQERSELAQTTRCTKCNWEGLLGETNCFNEDTYETLCPVCAQPIRIHVSEPKIIAPNLKAIVASWLRGHGYDGLCNVDHDCGCYIDEFMVCLGFVDGGPDEKCVPAYRMADPEYDRTFIMVTTKNWKSEKDRE